MCARARTRRCSRFTITTDDKSSQILLAGIARYLALLAPSQRGTTHAAAAAAEATTLGSLSVSVANTSDALDFGSDESYTMDIAKGKASLTAPTVYVRRCDQPSMFWLNPSSRVPSPRACRGCPSSSPPPFPPRRHQCGMPPHAAGVLA